MYVLYDYAFIKTATGTKRVTKSYFQEQFLTIASPSIANVCLER